MGFRKLRAYSMGYNLAMDIYLASKKFPKSETYALTDQVRRSSRSVCTNLAEAYRKRQYPKHFVSKLSDADAENSETQVWIAFAMDCGYLSAELGNEILKRSGEIGRLLQFMIANPGKFGSYPLPTATAN
ncbi:MAG TPA: four helix bundle protein [Robiginitalea sp.]|nr:four helix bundle protein [Robiginitalea sp.]